MIRYILILFCFVGYGQGIVNNPFVTFPDAGGAADYVLDNLSPLLYLTPASIDPEVTTDGSSLTSPFWEDTSGNGYDATTGGGSFVLNIGSTGRQVEWNAASWMDITDAVALELEGTEYTLVWRFGDDTNTTGSGYAISKATSSASSRTGAYFDADNSYGGIFIEGTENNGPSTVGNNSLAIVVVGASTYSMWIDGTIVVTNGTIGTGNADGQSWNIGGRSDGSYVAASGMMMDLVIIIPSAVDATERGNIETQWQVN